MSEWTPRQRRDVQLQALDLSGEEGFVLSRVDGSTPVKHIVLMTGFPEQRVRQILDRLVTVGAVEAGIDPSPPPAGADASLDDGEPDLTEEDDAIAADVQAAAERGGHANHHGHAEEHGHDAVAGDAEPEASPEEAADAQASDTEETRASHRKLYHESLADLDAGLREAMAQAADEPELSALCFDPLPGVVRAIFENPAAGPAHARLIARHHQTSQGLESVMARADLMRDPQTQRLLLHNPMLQEPQLKRLLQPRRLAEIYRFSTSREVPERNRQKARAVLRSKWSMCDGEERAALIIQSEGRCLAQLTGLPFDSRTISTLCSRSLTSVLLIQNIARFGATPPAVLAHLLKQQVVRRQQGLKTLILQHPNCPADAKRKG